MRIAQATFDFLGPMPRGGIVVRTDVLRTGRKVELLQATMEERDGRPFAVARIWRIRELASEERASTPPEPDLSQTRLQDALPGLEDWGYAHSIEWRFVAGGFEFVGPADVWTRARIPLVEGRVLDPISRALLVADSANGVSTERPFSEFVYVPPALTVTMLRHPSGEWIRLEARSEYGPGGIGASSFALSDTLGLFARGAQPLLVERRTT